MQLQPMMAYAIHLIAGCSTPKTDDDDCNADEYYDCDDADGDGDGVCDELEIAGCTDEMARNYDATATDDDGMRMSTPKNITIVTATA